MKTYIIAEIGVNHNANMYELNRILKALYNMPIDAIKFQLWSKDRFPAIEHLRLAKTSVKAAFGHIRANGISPFATAFDKESIDYLEDIGQQIWKIPSGMTTNVEFLNHISKKKGRKILSSGMTTKEELHDAIGCLYGSPHTRDGTLTVLHCVTAYPTPLGSVNLRAMLDIRDSLGVEVGLSDHSACIEMPVAAVGMGAKMVEVHVTLDREAKGPDHKASLGIEDFGGMVSMIRNVDAAMGDGVKKCEASEQFQKEDIRRVMSWQ